MDPRLHADLGRAERRRPRAPAGELLLGVLVGVRASVCDCPNPQNAQPTMQMLRDVDVAVDDERHRLPRQLLTQLVRGAPHLLDHPGPALGEQRRQLLGASAQRRPAPWRPPAARPRRRSRPLARRPEPAARNERPVAALDHVHHRPARSTRGRCTPDTRTAARSARARPPRKPLADLRRRRERVLRARCGRRWRSAHRGRSPPRATSSGPPIRQVRRHLDPDVRHQPPRLGDQPLHVLDRRPRTPTPAHPAAARRDSPVRQYSRAAASAISRRLAAVVALVRHEVLEDHLLDVAVARRAARPASPATRSAPPRSRRSRPGSRS